MADIEAHDAEAHAVRLTPVRGRDRIDVLDMLRGIAILGIFFMNIPFMAGPVWATMTDPRKMGWSGADQLTWTIINTTWDGTQRGLLEFLFGAGLMVTAAKAMAPDGPVAVADLYIRRNLWLLAFGLFDIFCLLWPGDILHVYALCALGLFPFRHLPVRWLVTLGLVFSAFVAVSGAVGYYERAQTAALNAAAVEHQRAGKPLSLKETEALKEWKKVEHRLAHGRPEDAERIAEETEARASTSMAPYAAFMIGAYLEIVNEGSLLFGVFEAFCAMLLGIALWKQGVLQGKRSTQEYLIILLIGYGVGMGLRYLGCVERLAFNPLPKTAWMTNEIARLLVTLGHVAAVNLLVRGAVGRTLMAPFKAAGRMAFSLYFMEQIAGLWIMFSPIGLHLAGGLGWAHLALQAGIVVVILLVFANVWMRYFVAGPFEWVWRTLAYGEPQPFRKVARAA